MIVLDASLLMAWLVTEELPSADTGIYETFPHSVLLVPSHWPIEVSNALRSRMRAGQLSVAGFQTIIERFDLLTIDVQQPLELDEVMPLAHFALSHNLTSYDAAYVQLALGRNAPLATLDRAMRTAAAKLNIPLLPV